MAKNDRTVYRRPEDNMWVNKRNDATRPASIHGTQKEAVQAARENLQNSGGGELTTMGTRGGIVSKDTIDTGNDPRSVIDTEH
ncbi:hypothetical protein IAD21_03481 [Abditibacteriota bacterium]|nr:hypothetical protein IAD21_03481 [Abditibacteriota bacterium]